VTDLEVNGQGPLGAIKAYGGASADGLGKVMTFEGPVFVTVYPAQEDKATKPVKKRSKKKK